MKDNISYTVDDITGDIRPDFDSLRTTESKDPYRGPIKLPDPQTLEILHGAAKRDVYKGENPWKIVAETIVAENAEPTSEELRRFTA